MSANAFLAPFERIVDFAVIDRDFDPERGELTPKGTYRRKVIERNFADTIKLLYRRTTLSLGGAEITVPNWLFQALGITAQELEIDDDRLTLGKRRLAVDDSASSRATRSGSDRSSTVTPGAAPSISVSSSRRLCSGWATASWSTSPRWTSNTATAAGAANAEIELARHLAHPSGDRDRPRRHR